MVFDPVSTELVEQMADRNGYVREAAIDRAVALGVPASWPVLLSALADRLNDWVGPVREKARLAVLALLARLDPDRDAAVAGALLLRVQDLRRTRRVDHGAWIASFEGAFLARMGAERIVAGIGSAQPRFAAACFTLASECSLAQPAELCRWALANRANVVLARRAMAVARDLPEAARQVVHRQALGAQAGIVRAEALRALLGAGVEDSVLLARSMLPDRNTWVRLVASAFLARQGIDVAACYAGLLAAESAHGTLRACLAGLAESGGVRYVDAVRACTRHDHARVQVAAFQAWMRLAPGDKDEIARYVLASGAKRVRRLFMVFVRKHGAYVQTDVALAMMRSHGDYDQMLALVEGDAWATLETIAEPALTVGGDAAVRARLTDALVRWQSCATSAYAAPSERQRAFLAQPGTQRVLAALLASDPRQRSRHRRPSVCIPEL